MIILIEPLSLALLNSGLPYRPQFARKSNSIDMQQEIFNIAFTVYLNESTEKKISHLVSVTPLCNSRIHRYYYNERAQLLK